jgi:hypothetical protein
MLVKSHSELNLFSDHDVFCVFVFSCLFGVPRVPAGPDARSDRAGSLPAVSFCSALLSG